MAKYDGRLDGCSGHLHQSFSSADGDRNLFWDADGPHRASEQMLANAPGVLATVPEMISPTPIFAAA
jgi:glutamine synthetase